MSKELFLRTLRSHLEGLPQSDIERSLDYYSEMIDDRIEDGMDEEQAAADLGEPAKIAEQIMLDTSLPKLVKAKVSRRRAPHTWEIVLLVLGSPLWLPLLLAVCSVIFAAYIVLWSLVFSVFCLDFGLGISGLVAVPGALWLCLAGMPLPALWLLGMGLILIGISVLLFFPCMRITKAILQLSRAILHAIKSIFIQKGEVQ